MEFLQLLLCEAQLNKLSKIVHVFFYRCALLQSKGSKISHNTTYRFFYFADFNVQEFLQNQSSKRVA